MTRVLRPQNRRADLHQYRGIRPRYSVRQHAGRASRRHVRSVAALPIARPHRPLQAARLRLSDDAAGPQTRPKPRERRLEVLQSLDQLGAGFTVASHDMDIRGAGNLLGEEQSGHVKEVGIELYQEMLEEAVAQMRSGERRSRRLPINGRRRSISARRCLFPKPMCPTSMCAWRYIAGSSTIETRADIERFAAELIDRFGRCRKK